MADAPRIAVAPMDHPNCAAMVNAVVAGGGVIADAADADALVWCAATDADALRAGVASAPNATWVQLPWAGIEPFVEALDNEHTWTCGKGVYAEPVAEMVLALALAGFRGLDLYVPARKWEREVGQNLAGANVVILGGGGITDALLALLAPFDCRVTVLRRHPRPMAGVAHVGTLADLDAVLPDADLVVLALALTPETKGVIGVSQLARMKSTAWIVNVARGCHIDTDALVDALDRNVIGGAALDVTDPEPLPDGHPLWALPNCIVTPHVANTREMGRVVLARRVTENVRRFGAGEPLLGLVDVELGY